VTAATTRRRSGCSTGWAIEYTAVGKHGGASRLRKLAALSGARACAGSRARAASTSPSPTARTTWRWPRAAADPGRQHLRLRVGHPAAPIGCRLAAARRDAEAIPPERLRRYGVGPEKLRQYPGLKEEYYLADFEPDPAVLDELGSTATASSSWCARRRTCPIYHRKANRCSRRCSTTSATRGRARPSCIPRTDQQRRDVRALEMPRWSCRRTPSTPEPDRAVRSRGLRRRHDEPRGGRPGQAVYTTYGGDWAASTKCSSAREDCDH
jgi:hypothetical protein